MPSSVTTTSNVASLRSMSDPELCGGNGNGEDAEAAAQNGETTTTLRNEDIRSSEAEDVAEETAAAAEDEEPASKSKTLPVNGRISALRLSAMRGKSSSLKRTIKNPFGGTSGAAAAVAARIKKPKKREGSEPVAMNEDEASASAAPPVDPASSSPSPSVPSKFALRHLFQRILNQVNASAMAAAAAASSGQAANGRSRYGNTAAASEEKMAEWKRRFEDGKVPGVVGIKNHGNTCFINAILQCLNHTDLLAEYFVLDAYKSDLRRKRRISNLASFGKRAASAASGGAAGGGGGGANGSRGEVTEQLATLLKSMWSLQYDPEISIRFKSLVEKHASQYKGSSQHDAQEFLLWLLDQVHEDLNLATRKKYKAAKNSVASSGVNGESASAARSDEVLAAEALASYMRVNNSFVTEVFQAQFRSSLTCPTCQKQSNTFDPFLCVSLPIPQKTLMPVYVVVLYIDQSPRQVRIGLTIGVDQSIGELRATLAKDTGIDATRLLLAEIDDVGFRRTLRDDQPVTVLRGSDRPPLYCIEMPTHKEASEDDGAFVVLTWVNVFKDRLQGGDLPVEKRFGSPYTIQVSRETLYCDLQKLLMKEMAPILHDDILIGSQKVPLFKIRVLDGLEKSEETRAAEDKKEAREVDKKTGESEKESEEVEQEAPTYLDAKVDLPMYTEAVEQAINLCALEKSSTGVPPHVKLVLEWDMAAKTQVINDDADSIEEHASVREVEKSPEEAASVSLQECFNLYTTAEKLGVGDAWLCPSCNRKQEVVKRMGLWSVPDVLVIHLKRFRQSNSATTCNKITTLIEFPLESFDMNPNMAKRQNPPPSTSSTPQPPPVTSSQSSDVAAVNNSSTSSSTANGGSTLRMWSALPPWRNPNKRPNGTNTAVSTLTTSARCTSDADCIYELYAVCNHHGGDLQGGHYTAFCKNPTDGQWYNFDDVRTRCITEQEVVSNDAYILFYQRQPVGGSEGGSAAASANGGSSSSSTSSGASNPEHWVFRMPNFTYKKKQPSSGASAAATTTTTTATPASASKSEPAKKEAPPKSAADSQSSANNTPGFTRNSAKYATMPAGEKRKSKVGSVSKGEAGEEEEEDDDQRHSDVEPATADHEEEEEEVDDVVLEKLRLKQSAAAAAAAPSTTAIVAPVAVAEEDDDGICRPLDKNDVD